MGLDLTPRWKDFAVYLPAQQYHFASLTDNNRGLPKGRPMPPGIKLTDLDFLNPKSKLWHYGYALYSAGQFDSVRNRACAVTNRDRGCTTVLGDSGGYQLGMGTLRGTEHLKDAKTAEELCAIWRRSNDIRQRLVSWLDTHCDYAMTIDVPIWAREEKHKNTPFHKCSVEQLIDLTLLNLEYIKDNRRGTAKWLNVLQGTNPQDSLQWWKAVQKYRFDGWALAGTVGWRGGLANVLEYVLTIRDDGGFDGTEWMHVLGTAMPVWAVLLTAIQRGIRENCNPNFRVSYDAASPFQVSGKYQNVTRYPIFTRDIETWVFKITKFPINPLYAKSDHHFPFSSPLGDQLKLSHVNVRGRMFEAIPVDAIGLAMLTNHNLYIYVRALLEANELAFMHASEAQKTVPHDLLNVCNLIGDLFSTKQWRPKLKQHMELVSKF